MLGLYEAFLSACDRYQAMQQAHLHGLATVAQPDLERLVFEREQFFADLRNHLTAVAYQWQNAVPESSLVPVLQARLAVLLEGDVVLAERLHAHRATLEQHRAQIQQGQKALDGYSGPAASLSPRFVNTSG
jgi:hypothetical protein